MKTFRSSVKFVDRILFPQFSGKRVMMMPFHVHDPLGSLPDSLKGYGETVARSFPVMGAGVGYITVDEAEVQAGTTHRRPGLHVDGRGSWGGGGTWASRGMYVAASRFGCVGYDQEFEGEVEDDGGAEHLRDQCRARDQVTMEGHCLFFCNGLAVHESVARPFDMKRQFLRVSLPNSCPWYEGYTPNPLGILPTGPILPARAAQMSYRP